MNSLLFNNDQNFRKKSSLLFFTYVTKVSGFDLRIGEVKTLFWDQPHGNKTPDIDYSDIRSNYFDEYSWYFRS